MKNIIILYFSLSFGINITIMIFLCNYPLKSKRSFHEAKSISIESRCLISLRGEGFILVMGAGVFCPECVYSRDLKHPIIVHCKCNDTVVLKPEELEALLCPALYVKKATLEIEIGSHIM
jgi:hypothetical protein